MFQFFKLPFFEDINKRQKAQLLHQILIGLAVMVSLSLVVQCFIVDDYYSRSLFIIISVNLICGGGIWLNKRGYTRLASVLFVGQCFSFIIGLSVTGGGISAPIIQFFPVIVITAGLILGWKEGIIAGVISALIGLLVVLLDRFGHLPESHHNYNSLSIWVFSVVVIGLLMLMQYLSVRDINSALQQAQYEIQLRRNAEIELRNSEEFRKRVFESSRIPIVVMDGKTNQFIDCNQAAVEIYQLRDKADFLNTKPMDFAPLYQEDGALSLRKARFYVREALQNGSVVFEWKHKHKNGELWDAELHLMSFVSNNKQLFQFSVQDITKRKKAELELKKYRNHLEQLVLERTDELAQANEELYVTNEELSSQREELMQMVQKLQTTQNQLIHSEKMASLGILSAGIAHEINNPLNFISGGVYALEEYIKANIPEHIEELRVILNAIETGIDRTTTIVSSLNRYSQQDDKTMAQCDVAKIIDNCLVMLQSQLKNKVEVLKEFSDKEYRLIGNEGKLHQAFLNILSNAEQAIESSGIIKIVLDVENSFLKVTVSDNGCGISKESLAKIFDPFYTSKAPGKGVGLGLSITYNIIQEHGGSIHYESVVGEGTQVSIILPITAV